MSRIAFVAALEREVRPLVKKWRVTTKEHSERTFRFFENEDAVLVCGGIGAEAARRAAEAVIVLYSPRVVYSVGYVGALDPGLQVGAGLRPARVIDAKDGSSVALAGGEGVLVSSGTVASPVQKAQLRESYHAQAVDMEAAAVARAAQARGVEFSVVKAVSDEFDFAFPSTELFIDSEGHFCETSFALFLAARPWFWLQAIRLARNSRLATRALCDEMNRIVRERLSPLEAVQSVNRQGIGNL